MPILTIQRLAVAALALLLAACGTGLLPDEPILEPGGRRWIITVENLSAQPARLMVAEDGLDMGDLVGTAEPNSVPANTTRDVVFTVPAGEGWAIFVNPSNERGPLVLAIDVPRHVTGRLPLSIQVGPNGDPTASVGAGAGPGWFGD